MAEKGKGGLRGGFRVFKLHVSSENLPKLKRLFRDFADGKTRTKGALCYRDEWMAEWENVLKMHEEAGRRTMPKPPAALLLVRFVLPDGSVRGNNAAPCVIDLRRGELRIPSYGVAVSLRGSIVEALIGENGLEPRPDFVLQVTRRGFLRLIASRSAPRRQSSNLLLICMDENVAHGLFTTLISFDGEDVEVLRGPTFKPTNAARLRRVAARLQSIVRKKTASQLFGLWVTPERARCLKRSANGKEARLNREYRAQAVAWLRKRIRDTDAEVVILIDEVVEETAKSGLVRRAVKAIRNLADYEGAEYLPLRASGKHCPRCRVGGVEVAPRTYKCPFCGLEWNRDRMATFKLALTYTKITKNKRLEEALLKWLNEHPRALLS